MVDTRILGRGVSLNWSVRLRWLAASTAATVALACVAACSACGPAVARTSGPGEPSAAPGAMPSAASTSASPEAVSATSAPAAGETPLALAQSFYFTYVFGGDYYVQLGNEPSVVPDEVEEPTGAQGKHWNPQTGASAGSWDGEPLAAPQEIKVLENRNPYALGVPFADPSRLSTPSAKGWNAHWEVYDGNTLLCSGGLTDFQVVGVVIPHFGEIEGWRGDPATSPEKNLENRLELFDRSAQHLMAKVSGCKKADVTGMKPKRFWARPASPFKPMVTDFTDRTPDDISAELSKKVAALPVWDGLVKEVDKAYASNSQEKPEPVETRVHLGVLLKEGKTYQEAASVSISYGDMTCGIGPAAAFLTRLYLRPVGGQWTSLFGRDANPDGPIEDPAILLFGDFNGDEKYEVVVRTNTYEDMQILIQIKEDGTYSEIKTTFLSYLDCPC